MIIKLGDYPEDRSLHREEVCAICLAKPEQIVSTIHYKDFMNFFINLLKWRLIRRR